MFSVLIPTFYAGSVHGFWIGVVVFFLMTALVLGTMYLHVWRQDFPEDTADDVDKAFKKFERTRFWIATIVCILIAISSMESCRIQENGMSVCQRIWGEETL
jgi:heme/copper-type cytochrome/quinol oxidase subunit 2